MKTIWVSGASTGIGLATAKKFLNSNWKVVISSSNYEKLLLAKKQLLLKSKNKELYAYKCDISDRNQVTETVNKITKQIGNINLGILNAAAYTPNKEQVFSIQNFEKLIDVNLKGTLFCIESLINNMKNNQNHIAIMASPVGYRGLPTSAAYGLTKAGLINLAESLFFDLKKEKIKISLINPGFIESELTKLNSFPMPFLKSADYAAEKIYKGLTGKYKFEIFFPWFFIIFLKLFRILPYKLYFFLISKFTKL